MQPVAVLCASKNSSYVGMPGVEVYDQLRDALTFNDDVPVIAHPPCRAWSAFCSHQAKPRQGEKELGLFCAEKLRECGGVLEQPAFSGLFKAAGLPLPGESTGECWSVYVWQYWWGYPTQKATWLCFCGIAQSSIIIPFRLKPAKRPGGDDRTAWQKMGNRQRSFTTRAFATWLVDTARLAA